MKALITGAAGFIASNFCHYLAEVRPEWQLTALDKLTYAGNLENISELIERKKLQFVRADIADAAGINALFAAQKFDAVFHFAAESHVDRSIHGALEFVQTNVLGTQCLLDASMAQSVTKFLHVSTDEVYGSLGPTGYFHETTPLDPTSPYAASKAASDLMVFAAAKTHKFNAVVTRCTNNYGPYQFPEKFIPLFVTNALESKSLPLYGDGMNVRSWLYVRDHCEALLLAFEKGRAGEAYNIGSGPDGEIPNIQVARKILSILNKPESLMQRVADRPAHDKRYAVDYSKAKAELGWEPRTPFESGIESTVRWYVDNARWWKNIKTGDYLSFYEQNYGNRR